MCAPSAAGDPYNTNAFRDSILTYVHYYANASIAPVVINAQGVGSYAATAATEAENYMRRSDGGEKVHDDSGGASGGFAVRAKAQRASGDRSASEGDARFVYPYVRGVPPAATLSVRATNRGGAPARVYAQFGGAPAFACAVLLPASSTAYSWLPCEPAAAAALTRLPAELTLTLVLDDGVAVDSWRFDSLPAHQ